MFRKILKILGIFLLSLVGISVIMFLMLFLGVKPKSPEAPAREKSIYEKQEIAVVDSGLTVLKNNWIRENRYGIWEMYIEGDAYNRGVAAGMLSEPLVKYQEEVFVKEINKYVPSKRYQKLLVTIIAWMNRNLTKTVPPEYLKEIYGISRSASHEFDAFGTGYERQLNYHAAHDIGHAFQSYYLVGCSSFATWNNYSVDSTLTIGRNFDFYFGDDFARNKIVEFVSPDSGYNFAFITWGGMIGVVSGMNAQGLTVTINAGTLEIGKKSATPVTLVAREILQYAGSIDEALTIARKRNIMVSESFLIGSATDKKVAVIEKKPDATSIAWPDSSVLICTNHFQSKDFKNEISNISNENGNATGYRFKRINELVNEYHTMSVAEFASVLRDKNGLNDKNIGLGNEKAVNQLLAHHSVIFQPEKLMMWVSTPPNVLGDYVAYDLGKIFAAGKAPVKNDPINVDSLTIPADSFLISGRYEDYLLYKIMRDSILVYSEQDQILDDKFIEEFVLLNPEYFETYKVLGDYYFNRNNFELAGKYYNIALTKEINSASALEYLNEQIGHCMKELS